MTEPQSPAAILHTDPPGAKPPLWTAPVRALSPVALSLLVAGIVFFVMPYMNIYQQDVAAKCGVYIILAVSLTVVNGFTGQFSIGHAGFMSLGGYAAASFMFYGTFHWFHDVDFHGGLLSWTGSRMQFVGHIISRGDILFLTSLLFGALVSAAIGWVVGLPSLRLRGDYLAIVTLGFCEIVRVIIQSTPQQLAVKPTDVDDVDATTQYLGDASMSHELHHLGGALGFSDAPSYATVFWITLATLLTLILTVRLKYSSYGRAMLSIREDDIAAQAVGVNITKLKVRAFVYSAFFAGLAGGLFSLHNGTISAGELGFQKSFDFVIMVVLGGMGSISGTTIAAIILTLLPELLRKPPSLWLWGWVWAAVIAGLIATFAPRRRGPLITLLCVCLGWETMRWLAKEFGVDLSEYRLVIYSLLLIIMMILRPQGLFGILEIWDYLPRKWQWWNKPNQERA